MQYVHTRKYSQFTKPNWRFEIRKVRVGTEYLPMTNSDVLRDALVSQREVDHESRRRLPASSSDVTSIKKADPE
jgi:hypothetical protein